MMHMGDITKCIWGFQFIGGYPLNALVIHHCTHDITLLHHDISPVTTINLKHLNFFRCLSDVFKFRCLSETSEKMHFHFFSDVFGLQLKHLNLQNSDVLKVKTSEKHLKKFRCFSDCSRFSGECTYDIPPQASRYPPMHSWYLPNALKDNLLTNHDIPHTNPPTHSLMPSWYPPIHPWYLPKALNDIPQCTAHTLYGVLITVPYCYFDRSLLTHEDSVLISLFRMSTDLHS